MATWTTFLDDSASEGIILDYQFNPKPIKTLTIADQNLPSLAGYITPIYAAGGVVIRNAALPALNREFSNLRYSIARKFNLTSPPIIHMRQLWGVNARADKGKNPFYGLSYADRLQIIKDVLRLISKYCIAGNMRVLAGWRDTAEQQVFWKPFFELPRSVLEKDFIFKKFGRRARKFYDIILNPLVDILCEFAVTTDKFCEVNGHISKIVYDTTDVSKGFDVVDVYEALRDIQHGKCLSGSACSFTKDEPMLQLADVVSFITFRQALRAFRKGSDTNLDFVLENISMNYINSQHFNHIHNFQSIPLAFKYILATQFLRDVDSVWVDLNMVGAEDVLLYMGTTESQSAHGMHLLKENVLGLTV